MNESLFLSTKTNELFISESTITNKPMGRRTPIGKGRFIYLILQWAKGEDVHKSGQVVLTYEGKDVAIITLNKAEV